MSKIPVAKKGFRSWLSTNEGKPSKSVLYEQKYQIHHDRIRNKENMSEGEGHSSSFVSMVNPQPTAADYERYDADRRLKEKARDMRVAQRSASSSARNSLSMTPEPKELSPSSDQYFTPKRESGSGLEDEFVTPSTSKKDRRQKRETDVTTPLSTKPPRYMSSEEHAYYTTCLSRKMEENFTKMHDLVLSGHTLEEARKQAIAETTRTDNRSPRSSARRSSVETTVIVNRSSSQPAPIEKLNSIPLFSRTSSPGPSRSNDPSTVHTSYVDTLVATHRMHMQYADRVVVSVEKQMTKLESMKFLQNLASLSPAAEEAKRRRMAADALRKLVETNEQREKKLEVVRDLKDRIRKITDVQLSTHQLVSNRPFKGDPYNERLLKSLDGWTSLPFHEFDVQTARELHLLQKKMLTTIEKFKNVASLHRNNNSNRSFNTSRKSIAMKIIPSQHSTEASSSEPSRNPPNQPTREAATQVTARLADVAMTQTSPRRVVVEPLDLSSLEKSSLEKRHSSSQTTPPRPSEDASQQTVFIEQPVVQSGAACDDTSKTAALSITTPTILDIDEMLNSIQLHNESLETIDSFSHFKSDISYPSVSSEPSVETTPRSGRVSLDPESARRLSSGLSQLLDKIKKDNESIEKKIEPEAEAEVEVNTENEVSHPPPIIQEDSPSAESEVHSSNQSPPTNEDSEVELNLCDHDATQFEHEMEEQEEQRQLRESIQTPTPPKPSEENYDAGGYSQNYIDPEDEEDETKKFTNNDEFERSLEDEQSDSLIREFNDSADDSGFLLDNKPAPRLKSIFDNVPTSDLRSDTPRISNVANESTFNHLDMEEYCQKDYLPEIGPVMIHKAIELQDEIRGLDWISAQNVWKPPSFEDIQMDFYDHFDYFDSYSVLLWGAVVDFINVNYLKFGRKLTESEERTFEKEALEMLEKEFGAESKKKEWSKEVKMSKKLEGMIPYELDYRYDIRRGLPETERQKYQWQQMQMTVIADRFPKKKLRDELDAVYNSEKENLGEVVLSAELEQMLDSSQRSIKEKMPRVSDV
ncbi:hypothetical protein B9Z55_009742 [Caenorhabditis nigoni]|uniref:Uncharacterized protein n=1 Tax=Caenorhabditis nigoni TaxID=1611254 RepID=A0A2G5UTD1_9PELO|nr:hypothetical protein B9Z55_009742 [Caenorhabditis nigoni]